MKKVRFLMDYRGKLTGEIFYTKGEVAEFEAGVAAALVEDKRAEYVNEKATKTAPAQSAG